MFKIISQKAETALDQHIEELSSGYEMSQWHQMTIVFNKDIISKAVLKSPLEAKRKIEAIKAIHENLSEKLATYFVDKSDANLYLLENMDIVLLLRTKSGSETYEYLQKFVQIMRVLHEDVLNIRFMPCLTKALERHANNDDYAMSVKEWQMFEAMTDTVKRRTITRMRDLREKPVVLLIEDDNFIAFQIKEFLKDVAGVIHVMSAEEGIKAYIDMAPDCVLLDIHLPKRSGFEALECLKKTDPEANVIVMTGDRVRKNVESAYNSGALNFMEKPLARDYLVSAVTELPLYRKARGY